AGGGDAMIAALAFMGALGTMAAAPDITSQDVVVDFTADVLHVDIDAHVDGVDGRMPMYGFVAGVTSAQVGGQDAQVIVDTDPRYQGMLVWLTPAAGVGGDDVDVHIVLDGAPACASKQSPGLSACTFVTSTSAQQLVLLPEEPGAGWYLTNLSATN